MNQKKTSKRKEDLFAPTLKIGKSDWIMPKGIIPQNGKFRICKCGIKIGMDYKLCGMCSTAETMKPIVNESKRL